MHNPSKMDQDRGMGCRRVPVGVGARSSTRGRSAPLSSYHHNVEYGPVHEHPGDRRAELYYFDPLAGGVGGLRQGQIGSAERAGIYGAVAGRWPGMGGPLTECIEHVKEGCSKLSKEKQAKCLAGYAWTCLKAYGPEGNKQRPPQRAHQSKSLARMSSRKFSTALVR
jgi:hypothetical protein